MQSAGAGSDVDLVLTTRELARIVRAEHIDVEQLADSPFDDPLGNGSGAGVIFGATGGVMEAALRFAYFLTTGENPSADAFCEVRAVENESRPWREAAFDLAGTTRGSLRICRDHGLPRRLCRRRRPAGRWQ